MTQDRDFKTPKLVKNLGSHHPISQIKKSIVDELGFAFNDIIETYGAPIAHDNEQDVLIRLSDLIGNEKKR